MGDPDCPYLKFSDPLKVPKMNVSAFWGWNLLQEASQWVGVWSEDAPPVVVRSYPNEPGLKHQVQSLFDAPSYKLWIVQ